MPNFSPESILFQKQGRRRTHRKMRSIGQSQRKHSKGVETNTPRIQVFHDKFGVKLGNVKDKMNEKKRFVKRCERLGRRSGKAGGGSNSLPG